MPAPNVLVRLSVTHRNSVLGLVFEEKLTCEHGTQSSSSSLSTEMLFATIATESVHTTFSATFAARHFV